MKEVIWVLFKADHGGGHQSHTKEYKPYLYGVDDDGLDRELERWCRDMNNVKATATIVDELPPDIIHDQMRKHAASVHYNNHILLSLIGD